MIPALFLAVAEGGAAFSLVSLLIWLVVFAVVIYVLFLILGMFPLPEPIKTIILCVVGVILLVIFAQRLGFF
jgi:hypothetical protein